VRCGGRGRRRNRDREGAPARDRYRCGRGHSSGSVPRPSSGSRRTGHWPSINRGCLVSGHSRPTLTPLRYKVPFAGDVPKDRDPDSRARPRTGPLRQQGRGEAGNLPVPAAIANALRMLAASASPICLHGRAGACCSRRCCRLTSCVPALETLACYRHQSRFMLLVYRFGGACGDTVERHLATR